MHTTVRNIHAVVYNHTHSHSMYSMCNSCKVSHYHVCTYTHTKRRTVCSRSPQHMDGLEGLLAVNHHRLLTTQIRCQAIYWGVLPISHYNGIWFPLPPSPPLLPPPLCFSVFRPFQLADFFLQMRS